MCGIFGFTDICSDPNAVLKVMAGQQLHRGPDGEGYFVANGISMGMRRLSIIDIEHGQQPFFNENKDVAVICNGEIYNYIELRKELIGLGHNFYTQSDVEVIPHLYEEYGADFAGKLNGMFAIALYDTKKGQLLLVRDRLGIKPLYYSTKDGGISFASELRSLISAGKAGSDLDYRALSAYLDLMYIPCPLTPFKSINKLPSGTVLVHGSGKTQMIKYWEPVLKRPEIKDAGQAEEEIDRILKDSIRIGMRSDVPVGALLSGGVDSSGVTALASMMTGYRMSTFHTEWKNIEGKSNESPYARMVSKQYGTDHHEREVTEKELVSLLPMLIWHLEEPFADGAFVPTFTLSKLASENVKVVLSGAGGDELFGGYSHHKITGRLKNMIKAIVFRKDERGSYYDKIQPNKTLPWEATFDWYKKNAVRDLVDVTYKRFKHIDELNAIMATDLTVYLQDDILMLTDKMTMAASVECRVPLLDHRLVELSLKMDPSLKVRSGEGKYVLKKLMERYLPKEILYRRKEGFGAPIQTWVNRNKAKVFDRLLGKGVLATEFASPSRIKHLCSTPVLEKVEGWEYWKLIVLEIWFRLFVLGEKYENIIQ